MNKDHAELVIMTENNFVKGVVEANVMQLKDNFQQADINLTHIDVQLSQNGNEGRNNQFSQDATNKEITRNSNIHNEINTGESINKTVKRLDSLVDTYV